MTNTQKIKKLEIELGERTKALIAQEPYKSLTNSNMGVYKMIQGRIKSIEWMIDFLHHLEAKKAERESATLSMPEADCSEYDMSVGTGMDTSIDINDFGQTQTNE